MLRADYPTLLTWRGEARFDQAQDQQVVTTRSPRIVTECLLTRSMLIKMYVYAIYSRFRIGTILSIRKHGYEFITTLSLSSLTSPFSLSSKKILIFYLGFTARQDYFTHFEPCQLESEAKTGDPRVKPPDHPQAEHGLSHM